MQSEINLSTEDEYIVLNITMHALTPVRNMLHELEETTHYL